MKAVYTNSYDGADGLEYGDRPEPKMQPDSMIVRVLSASVNPVDWKILQGYNDGKFPTIFPLITGWDVCGEVVEKGPAVLDFETGDKIVAYARKDFIGEGSWAEFVNVPERCAAAAPDSVTDVEAACIPLAGLTAYQAVAEHIGLREGETIVINGAAGGVGSFAVQIANELGGTVIGTGGEQSFARIEDLGATPIPYGDGFVEAVREAAPDGVDAVFDLYGGQGLLDAREVVKRDGRIATIGLPADAEKAGARYLFVKPNSDQLARLVEMVDSGELRITVQQEFALADAAEAVRLAEQKHTHGKLVLIP